MITVLQTCCEHRFLKDRWDPAWIYNKEVPLQKEKDETEFALSSPIPSSTTASDIGALSVTWRERNCSMKRGTAGPEKGHFARPLHLQSPASSSSLLPPANVIPFSFIVWVLTRCRPTAMFFTLGEIGKPELSLLCWYLYCAVFGVFLLLFFI